MLLALCVEHPLEADQVRRGDKQEYYVRRMVRIAVTHSLFPHRGQVC